MEENRTAGPYRIKAPAAFAQGFFQQGVSLSLMQMCRAKLAKEHQVKENARYHAATDTASGSPYTNTWEKAQRVMTRQVTAPILLAGDRGSREIILMPQYAKTTVAHAARHGSRFMAMPGRFARERMTGQASRRAGAGIASGSL